MSTVETMNVHKALTELKILDSRIEETIRNGSFCVANKHSSDKINGVPVDDYIKTMQGAYDKATDLISRRKAIKRAVVLSNAKTMVKIAGVEYTVAEAIEMKNHGIEFDQMLKNQMANQHFNAVNVASIKNEGLEEKANVYVTGLYGSKEGKTNQVEIDRAKETFIQMNEYELVDPLNVLKKIESLEKEIDGFMAEVDAALSVSNSLTEITVEY